MPGWHTIIRGLAPQAGGFRRRSNRIASVGLSAWLIVVNERLPCVLQVVAATCSSVSYLNTCQTCNPGSDPVASHAQYITNRIHRIAFGGTESGWGKDVFETSSPQNLDIWNVDVCQRYARRPLSPLLSVSRERGLRCLPRLKAAWGNVELICLTQIHRFTKRFLLVYKKIFTGLQKDF